MDVALYKQAQQIFDALSDLPEAEQRRALTAACADQPGLRALVEDFLRLDGHESQTDKVELIIDSAAVAVAESQGGLEPGMKVERYRVVRLLGVGGTARVWEVVHRTLDTRFALKVLSWADPRLQRRLLREARAQARLDHPNLVPVHDVLDVRGQPGILMSLIAGPALDELLEHHRPSEAEARALMAGVVAGVAHAHQEGLAHRDLKPANVMLDLRDGLVVPRVTDFGLVKGAQERTWTRPGAVMGTISYAAPEQLFDSANADERADIWSLGVMLYELLTGQRPFSAPALDKIMEAQQLGPDLGPVPAGLRALVGAMLTPDPTHRLSSCAEVAAALAHDGRIALDAPLGQAALALALPAASEAGPKLDPETSDSDAQDPDPRAEETFYELQGGPGPTIVATPSVGGGQAVAAAPPPVPANASSARWRAPMAFLLVGALGVWAFVAFGPGPAQAPDPAPTAPVEPRPSPAPVDPAPAATDPAEPTPPLSAAAPTPAAQAAPQPVPTRAPEAAPPATPVPEEIAPPAPEDNVSPPPEAAPAQVSVQGDPGTARLVGSTGQIYPPGPVPAGRYRFEATMPKRGNLVVLELGALGSGQQVQINCDVAFGMCAIGGG